MRQHRITPGTVAAIETREDGSRFIHGYAAVFYRAGEPGTEYRMYSDLVERIAPTAFDRALRESQDVRGLLNHDANMLLGRTASNTLRLSVDDRGLRYEIDVPDTTVGRDTAVMLDRGDLRGSSFSFMPKGIAWTKEGDTEVRTLTDVDLYDVGPVTFPAYEGTTAGARSVGGCDELLASRDAWRAEQAAEATHAQEIAERERLAVRAKIAAAPR